MKKRKGFATIDIDGIKFLFNWADNPDGPMLVMYNEHDAKIEMPYRIWHLYPDSDEYTVHTKRNWQGRTWHGKHKKGASWAGWGKREAREMYFKYVRALEEAMQFAV